eukprot:c16832_g1_i3.p2 GENE.c16832_g1_i3~~c16832_g1_i3.p2  ORF type:complete len:137 (+),score=36.60 c16832_g1_i3:302-712(+)
MDDIDGAPMNDVDGAPMDDIDGAPMDDLDGAPIDDAPKRTLNKSKWDEIDSDDDKPILPSRKAPPSPEFEKSESPPPSPVATSNVSRDLLRRVEVEVMELAERLESQGAKGGEIESQCNKLRTKLMEQGLGKRQRR